MYASQLLACSGPNAYRVIMEAQIYAATLGYVSAGIVTLSIAALWLRSSGPLGILVLGGMLVFHPAFWMSASHGDCGSTLDACSTIWTTILGLTSAGLVLRAWTRKSPVDVLAEP